MRKIMLVLVAAAALWFPAGSAWAHAHLERASPAVGSQVPTAPAELRLWFSEAVEPAFSVITVTGPDGKPVPTAAAAVDPKDGAQLFVKLPALAPGKYTVTWHVVSVDTHRTEGTFSFQVGA